MTDKAIRPLVAYYRVSTKKQGISGLGLEAQQAAVRAYAEKYGLSLLAEFTEVESGKVVDRTELHKALAVAKRLRACLCVAKLDRLSRDAAFTLGLKASGVDFVACDMPHANRMVIGILAVIAEYERELGVERTKAGLAAAKARGVVLGGFRGKDGEDPAVITQRGRDTMVANAAKRRARCAPLVAAALQFCENNLQETARVLNSSDVPTPSGAGSWHARMVAKFLERGEIKSRKTRKKN